MRYFGKKTCADIPHNLRFHTEISNSPKQIDAMFQQFKNTLCSKKIIHTRLDLDVPKLGSVINAHKCDLTRQIFI